MYCKEMGGDGGRVAALLTLPGSTLPLAPPPPPPPPRVDMLLLLAPGAGERCLSGVGARLLPLLLQPLLQPGRAPIGEVLRERACARSVVVVWRWR